MLKFPPFRWTGAHPEQIGLEKKTRLFLRLRLIPDMFCHFMMFCFEVDPRACGRRAKLTKQKFVKVKEVQL